MTFTQYLTVLFDIHHHNWKHCICGSVCTWVGVHSTLKQHLIETANSDRWHFYYKVNMCGPLLFKLLATCFASCMFPPVLFSSARSPSLPPLLLLSLCILSHTHARACVWERMQSESKSKGGREGDRAEEKRTGGNMQDAKHVASNLNSKGPHILTL